METWNQYVLTYLLTPWSTILLEKLTAFEASQEIPRIFGTRRFITVLTSARHPSLSWANSIQSSPFPLPVRGASSRNTPPAKIRVGGVVYLRIVLSPEEASRHVSITKLFFSRGGVVSTSPNPQAGGPPLVGCPQLLIQFIRSSPPYRRPFLHPQPEDAPCRGDRDPLITWSICR